MRGYSGKATKWVDFVMTDSTRRESRHSPNLLELSAKVKNQSVKKHPTGAATTSRYVLGFASLLPLVGTLICADQREGRRETGKHVTK
jgi:hypothetical protein